MEKMKTIDEFRVGESYRDRKLVSDAAVRAFADVSGDRNAIHLDDAYAKSTRFGGRIAHGALLVAYISKVLGMDLPGPGAVYLSQTIEFLAPVYVGEEIDVVVRVEEIDLAGRVLTLANSILNSKGAEVARGISKAKLPKAKA
jgi:3-hydroxybutyryl-CoA dehydratase